MVKRSKVPTGAGTKRASRVPLPPLEQEALREKALEVHRRLCREYGCPIPFFSTHEPMSELIDALLSHRTPNRVTRATFRTLRERYPTWEALRDAPTDGVQDAISAVTFPEVKAPRIQAVLREIGERTGGTFDLSFLGQMTVREARDWLESMPGVGPKTSAATLLFSQLRMPALPVDSHHHRVAQRLALIGPKVSPGEAHRLLEAQLPSDWDAQAVYDNHEALMIHGQRVCTFNAPACERCVLLDLCPTGQSLQAAVREAQ